MLVLSRKRMESLMIGSGVRVTVLKTEGGSVRLGIEAPQSVSVVRAELLDRPKKVGRVAKAGHPSPAVVAGE